jgi:hypothetical protein
MTIYNCPTCKGIHDTSDPKNMMCPQVIHCDVRPQPEPISPDESRPIWERRYFCPQCPRLNQPRDGFWLPGLIEHAASHSSAYLREALLDLRRLDSALHELDDNTKVIPGLAMMYVRLALVRAFHHKDKAAFAAWTEVARGAENCPTCAAKWKQQAPSPTPAPGAGEQRKGEE